MSVTGQAVWYIESHLSGDLSLEAIAGAVGVSRFHLSRAFSLTLGSALGSYVRSRRLSEAAKVLVGGAPDILAVALQTGYGSHEAFTRAFRQHFGLTPDELRARAHLGGINLLEPLRMGSNNQATLDRPRIVRSDALLILYGKASPAWVAERADQARGAVRKRTRAGKGPFVALVYDGPPPNKADLPFGYQEVAVVTSRDQLARDDIISTIKNHLGE